MDCRTFEVRLEAWMAGELAAETARAVEEHAGGCASCRELLGLATAAATEPAEADVASAVMLRTSGPACASAEGRFGAWQDGDLDPVEAALVAAHVERCAGCAALAAVLERLPAELAAMAEARPPAGFVDAVLARTVVVPTLGQRLRRAWAPPLRRWLARPRFAVEAAYVATVLVAVVVGLSPHGVEAAPVAAVELLRQPVETLESVAGGRPAGALAAVRERAGAGVDGTRQVLGSAGDGLRTFWRGVASFLQSPDERTSEPQIETEERS